MKKLINFILNIISLVYLFKGIETEVVKYRLEDENLFIDKDFIKELLKAYKEDIIYNLSEKLYNVLED